MVKRVSKRVSEIVFLIAAGGSTYYLIEIWFRGFSHWTMFVLGGVALTFCSFQGEVMHWSEPMWIQIIRAVLFLTSLEFMTGIICNKWLKIGIWDYRDQPFQLCGQICLPFMVMFSGLLCLAIVLGGVVLGAYMGRKSRSFMCCKRDLSIFYI